MLKPCGTLFKVATGRVPPPLRRQNEKFSKHSEVTPHSHLKGIFMLIKKIMFVMVKNSLTKGNLKKNGQKIVFLAKSAKFCQICEVTFCDSVT